MQKDQRIGAAGNCHQNFLAGRKQAVLPDRGNGTLEEVITHAGILPIL
jgi:hypothetical protein